MWRYISILRSSLSGMPEASLKLKRYTGPDHHPVDDRPLGRDVRQASNLEERISELIQASIATKQKLLQDAALISTMAEVSRIIVEALRQGNKILLCGNGGSAADAQHIAAEFVGRFAFDRPALPAL